MLLGCTNGYNGYKIGFICKEMTVGVLTLSVGPSDFVLTCDLILMCILCKTDLGSVFLVLFPLCVSLCRAEGTRWETR